MLVLRGLGIIRQILMPLNLPDNGDQMDVPEPVAFIQCGLAGLLYSFVPVLFFFYLPVFLFL